MRLAFNLEWSEYEAVYLELLQLILEGVEKWEFDGSFAANKAVLNVSQMKIEFAYFNHYI